ncbi:MAG: metallophosphoesterase family protein [Chloroflexi bacterium]|nr:metallophosphoesterase family protein [Chloroflexota bacterium]
MRIGLISDTHIPQQVASLPSRLADVFAGVDLILHAGDICAFSVLDELEAIAPVLAARGDDDPVTVYDARVKESHRITLGGLRLWLTHVPPSPSRYDWYKNDSPYEPYVADTDIVVFGHNHIPRIDYYKSILLVSPGSATLPNYAQRPGTVAILTIVDGKAEAIIHQLE